MQSGSLTIDTNIKEVLKNIYACSVCGSHRAPYMRKLEGLKEEFWKQKQEKGIKRFGDWSLIIWEHLEIVELWWR